MATKTRIYKSTDWKVWTYTPTAGVFRLDFSKWDDGSDWGTTGGSITTIDLPIAQININENFEPIYGISQISAASASIAFQISEFNKSVISEFYTGKPIYITLKNEETTRLHSIFGQNTPIFSGYISSANFTYNPFDIVQSLVITVTDSMQYLFNTPLSVIKRKNDEFDNKWLDLESAFFTNTTEITRPIECLNDNYSFYNFSVGPNDIPSNISYQYETAGTEILSVGEWLQDLVNTLSARVICSYKYVFVNKGTNQFTGFKNFQLSGLSISNGSSAKVIESNKVISVNVGNSFADKPSVFSLSTKAGSSYLFGQSVANSSNQVITYSQTLNSPLSDLSKMVTAMLELKNWISPTEITLELAVENQEITFDNSMGSKYLYPLNLLQCSDIINLNLTSYGFELEDSYSFITAREIDITPNNVLVTYQTKRTE
jgi:hypothetical protein